MRLNEALTNDQSLAGSQRRWRSQGALPPPLTTRPINQEEQSTQPVAAAFFARATRQLPESTHALQTGPVNFFDACSGYINKQEAGVVDILDKTSLSQP
ncbi:hypothetical protein MRX96_025046 [Rhipicephalus microplus]